MGLHRLERNRHSEPRLAQWLLPGVVLLVAGLLMLGGDTAMEWMRFERGGIRSGQVWRLLSGHFVHLGWAHFTLNAAGLALVWYLVGDAFGLPKWTLISLVCVVTIDIGFWMFAPELEWYVGLSGLLHGLLAAGLVARLRKPDTEAIALAVLLLGKLAWEQLYGPLPGSEATAGGAVVVDSHLFGALGGVLAAIGFGIRVWHDRPI